MIQIENCRPGRLLLPESKLSLPPKSRISIPTSNEEIERAVKAGWIRIVEPESSSPDEEQSSTGTLSRESGSTRPAGHDWQIDYAQAGAGIITITDRNSGKVLQCDVAEKKGDQHYTLKNFGTVKGQQFWGTALALEQFDAA